MRVLISLPPCHHLPHNCLLDYSHPSENKVIFYRGFTYMSLMTDDVEYLFMCVLVIYVSSLEKKDLSVKPFPYFIGLFVFFIVRLYQT